MESATPPHPSDTTPGRNPLLPGTVTILIADDRALERECLSEVLTYAGYRLMEATNGAEALSLAEKHRPDLIITDIVMPSMDGYELVRAIRERPAIAHTRVIFYSSTFSEAEATALGVNAGAVRFMNKPTEPRALLAFVERALEVPVPEAAQPSDAEVEHAHLRLLAEKLFAQNEQLEAEVEERRRAEGELRKQARLLDLAHDAIVVCDFASTRISFWNQGAERLYGWTAAQALGRSLPDLLFRNPAACAALTAELLATGEARTELTQVTMDRVEIRVSLRATLVRDAAGRPISALLIHTNITEQRKLEEQFLRAQRLESIGTLASGVAHDLNNILSPILMAAPMLRGELSLKKREFLASAIEQAAERGAALVRQVLMFARGSQGGHVLLQPKHLLSEMAKIAAETFPKTIAVKFRYDHELWLIEGDPTNLHQVLLNLSVNARDAMPEGGTLTLTAENVTLDEHYAGMVPGARPGRYVLLTAADTGTGIPDAILGQIFDPFFTTKALTQGTGLGLSTVAGIVKSHGGLLDVESQPGHGTTFRIYLPAAEANAVEDDSAEIAPPPLGQGELVLVVDDEASIRGLTGQTLEQHGYRVLLAGDGVEALAQFAGHLSEVRVVLTDLLMPVLDGIALTRVLKKLRPEVPVLGSTGDGAEPLLHEAREAGAGQILLKPYDTGRLLLAVREALEAAPTPQVP